MRAVPKLFEFEGAGVRLAAERWSAVRTSGTVILLHGGGQTRHSWARTAERLATDGWDTIAYDARGHGDSDWHPGGDYTLDGFVAGSAGACWDTGVGSCSDRSLTRRGHVIGRGRRAPWDRSGDRAGRIVIEVERRGVARILEFLAAHREGFGTLAEVADAIAAYNPVRRRPRNLDGLRKNVRQRADGRWYWHWDPAFIQIGDEPQRQANPGRLRRAASSLLIPTLLVRGAQSDVVSDAGMADMLKLIPQAASIVISDAGQMVAGDDNDVFVSGVESFLDRLD